MKDQFSTWDTFMRHYELTRDTHQALRWTRYDQWATSRRLKHLAFLARSQAVLSQLQESGEASPTTT